MNNKTVLPFFDHRPMHQQIDRELKHAINLVLEGNALVLGSEVAAFESAVGEYCGCKFAIGVNSGLDALVISLKALGIGHGDEVIVPSNTYIATWMAVTHVGARPVPVEPDENTFNINANLIEAAITKKTKAILPVHLFGLPCEMKAIMDIAEKHNLYVVEDNAQAFGAEYQNKKTSSFGHINATSFYPTKNLGALGDGGMITTDNETLYEKCKLLRNYGSSKRYYNELIGYNSRLDELQAAILNVKIKYLEEWNLMRRSLASYYIENLTGIGDLVLPVQHKEHIFHLFCIRTKFRDNLMVFLSEQNISTLIHYPVPPHLQQCYSELSFKQGDFPIAEKIAGQSLSLPLYIGMGDSQVRVVRAIKEFFSQ